MADYKEIYLSLFRNVTKAITLLQETQLEAEQIFISTDEPRLQVLPLVIDAISAEEENSSEKPDSRCINQLNT